MDGENKRQYLIRRSRELRQSQTPMEAKLWHRLRAGQLCGLKFRRQHPIGTYIVDFLCEEAKLVIELDGDTHFGRDEQDAERARHIRGLGYAVLRATNQDVRENIDGVLETILRECEQRRVHAQQCESAPSP